MYLSDVSVFLIPSSILTGLGVDSGDTIRVPEAGNSGPRGSQPGWLYIKLKAQFYSYFFPYKITLSSYEDLRDSSQLCLLL